MSPAAPRRDPLLGRLLGERYRIESVVARGGMSVVYRAIDDRLQRPVAVKVLSEPYAADKVFVARFLDEARTAASVTHPNLAHVYDSGSDAGMHYMVLELLADHRPLRSEVREHGPLPVDAAVRVVLDVLAGLEPLHRLGLVHCDVKSGNVMIGPNGTKLIDFGIARPQREAGLGKTSIGSLHAMSPEQLRGGELTAASDIFAAGVVLYEALTGQVPFPGGSPEEIARAHAAGAPRPPSAMRPEVGELLDDVVLQSLRSEPERRFSSAAAMIVALTSARDAQRVSRDRSDETTAVHRLPGVPAGVASADVAKRRGRLGPAGWTALAVAIPVLVVGYLLFAQLRPASPPPAADPGGASASPSLAPGTVRVPATIGLSEAEAEAAARAAGLNWRIEWRIVPGQNPGVYDQEPAAGTVVEQGSRFVMYAYRSR